MTESIEDYEARQAAEYGKFVANGPIFIHGVRAYNDGDPVPVSNVEAHKYLEMGQVRQVGEAKPQPEPPAPTPVGDPIEINPETSAPDGGATEPSSDPAPKKKD